MSIGNGLTNASGELSLNFASDVPVQRETRGLYVPKDAIGDGIEGRIDYHTITPWYKNSKGTFIGVNDDVVVSIFTMSYKFRSNMTSQQSNYQSSLTSATKTIENIMQELNCVIDAWWASEGGVPDGKGHTAYKITPGSFFQFRTKARPTQEIYGWPVAQDDLNRYEEDPIVAFFYVEEAVYGWTEDQFYITKLTLKCVWSTLADYVVGQTYTHTITTFPDAT